MSAALTIRALRVRYRGTTAPVIDGLDLELAAGARLGLLGGNGSGKTTLAQALVGIVPEFVAAEVGGRISVAGERLEGLTIQQRLGRVGYSFQDVDSQILFGNVNEILGLAEPLTRRDLMDEAIAVLGLADLLERMPSQLSGGQAQRLALAAALRRGPDLIIYDEATTALDPLARERFGALVAGLSRRGHALILIGQRRSMLAPYAHCLAELVAGRLGDPAEAGRDIETTVHRWLALLDTLDRNPRGPAPALGLKLRELETSYRGAGSFRFGPVSARVEPGQVVALVGVNGSGKSTLFRLLLGAMKPRGGDIVVTGASSGGAASIDRIPLSALFQNPSAQIIGATVAEELDMAFLPTQAGDGTMFARSLPDVFPFLQPNRDPLELSYGQQKLLCLVRLVLDARSLVLLDEPEQGLDELHVSLLRSWLRRAREARHQTVLFATHDLDLATDCADQVWLFNEGLLTKSFERPTTRELWEAFHAL